MYPSTILVVEEVLPRVRRKVARRLYSEGISQNEISRLLGTSQAMVSKYLKERYDDQNLMKQMIRKISDELVVAALAGETSEELTIRFDRLISTAIKGSEFRKRYFEKAGFDLHLEKDRDDELIIRRSIVLDDLALSLEHLRKEPIPDLIPALKVNIASSFKVYCSE